jgi:DNA polymerase III gamma/tau subunit
MTISAANALLKEFEEPLPNRLIIGTFDEGKKILDTILSRAFLIKFHRVLPESMHALLPHDLDSELGKFILSLSRGRP